MNRKLNSALFLLTVLLIIIGACAKVNAPAGGPKDKQPPVVIKSIPDSSATNFRGKKISITFDEYIALDNINENLVVSPPLKKKPQVSTKGASIIIEFDEDLKDSTTYTLYFQDAIKDLNEGNKLEDYTFVFSTGPKVDSLSVTGNVFHTYDLEIPEKSVVIMYRELADSSVKKLLPDYISMINEYGYFRIRNVKDGSYRLYALKDADNSKNYNLEDEEFAFADSIIKVTPEKNFIPVVKDTASLKKKPQSTKKEAPATKKEIEKISAKDTIPGEHQLFMFKALRKNHYLAGSAREQKYLMTYALSLPPASMTFNFSIPGISADAYYVENSKGKDTIKIWITDSTLYSQQNISTIIRYPFTDSTGTLGYKEDTIPMRFSAPRVPKSSKVKKPKFSVETNMMTGTLKPGQEISIKAQTPFREPDTSLIRLYNVSDTNRIIMPYQFIKDSTNICRYFLKTKLEPGKKYLFIADSASFRNIYNECTDSTGIKFTVKEASSYSKITLNIKNYKGDLIIQLLNSSEIIQSEILLKTDRNLVFPLLENGNYRLRAIYDLDGDGKWSTGDFTTRRQPEPVSYYPGEIEIKTGWEVEQDWDLGTKNVKIQKLRSKKKPK